MIALTDLGTFAGQRGDFTVAEPSLTEARSTSTDQYGGTLARWFGVQPEQLPAVFPNIAKFGTANLGFMG